MSDKKARVIVVTGVTRGLGHALASGFVKAGHTVIGCGRSLKALEELRRHCGKPHRFDRVDVSDEAQVSAWARSVMEEFGPPGLLLNNAALINQNAALWEVPAAEFSTLIDVNIIESKLYISLRVNVSN